METSNLPDFIIFDDDTINNSLCNRLINNEFPNANIYTFTDPEVGMIHIEDKYSAIDAPNAILFLDINMETLTSWDVLQQLKNSKGFVMQHLRIYILSSSAYYGDKEKVAHEPVIRGFIDKPLKHADLQAIISKM